MQSGIPYRGSGKSALPTLGGWQHFINFNREESKEADSVNRNFIALLISWWNWRKSGSFGGKEGFNRQRLIGGNAAFAGTSRVGHCSRVARALHNAPPINVHDAKETPKSHLIPSRTQLPPTEPQWDSMSRPLGGEHRRFFLSDFTVSRSVYFNLRSRKTTDTLDKHFRQRFFGDLDAPRLKRRWIRDATRRHIYVHLYRIAPHRIETLFGFRVCRCLRARVRWRGKGLSSRRTGPPPSTPGPSRPSTTIGARPTTDMPSTPSTDIRKGCGKTPGRFIPSPWSQMTNTIMARAISTRAIQTQ